MITPVVADFNNPPVNVRRGFTVFLSCRDSELASMRAYAYWVARKGDCRSGGTSLSVSMKVLGILSVYDSGVSFRNY